MTPRSKHVNQRAHALDTEKAMQATRETSIEASVAGDTVSNGIELGTFMLPTAISSYTDKHAKREVHSAIEIPILCPKPSAFRAKGFFAGLVVQGITWAVAMSTSGVMCVRLPVRSWQFHSAPDL